MKEQTDKIINEVPDFMEFDIIETQTSILKKQKRLKDVDLDGEMLYDVCPQDGFDIIIEGEI